MNVEQILGNWTAKLQQAGIGTARLDVLVLLEDLLKRDRAWVLAHPEYELSKVQERRLANKLTRRTNHEPLAYIRGFSEFYGRRFKVNRHVLEPRPESETMIDLLKQIVDRRQKTADSSFSQSAVYRLPSTLSIADVGTGSGALGITAALELPPSRVDLYDISSGALAVAKHNVHLHELKLHARKMNLLSRPLRPYDVLLANLPYMPERWQINQAAMAEPKIAIYGGKDGLDLYRKLFHQLGRFTWHPQFVLTESLPPQHAKLAAIAAGAGYNLSNSQDFIQVFQKGS